MNSPEKLDNRENDVSKDENGVYKNLKHLHGTLGLAFK